MNRDEIEKLLDGTTPGPWRAEGEPWNRIVWSSAENRVCFMAHSNGLDDARDIATSNLAAAAPDLARALLTTRAELAASRARVAGLADFIAEFAAAKIDALRYQPAYGESPEDAPDPVVDAETVWAWQADAKDALAEHGAARDDKARGK